jgi:hypothetical protein
VERYLERGLSFVRIGCNAIWAHQIRNHNAYQGEAAQSVSITLRIIVMPRASARIAYWVCVAVLGAVLAGCAETTYPSLPTLPSVGDSLLTPTEQQKTIKDISGNKPTATAAEKPADGR